MSEYEKQREANIAANNAMLRDLGFAQNPAPMRQEETPLVIKKRKYAKRQSDQALDMSDISVRRSRRTRSTVKRFQFDDEDEDDASEGHDDDRLGPDLQRSEQVQVHKVKHANEDAVLACKAKFELLASRFGTISSCTSSNDYYREALRRWGPRIAPEASVDDWKTFVESRTSQPPPLPSPYALLQEQYAADPWYLLCACILMSRVSAAHVKDRCLGEFFQLCPSPSHFVDLDHSILQPVLHSLGLFPQRLDGLVDLTARFLTLPIFEVGLEKEVKIKGVGPFGVDSYLIFCKDSNITPTDKALTAFVQWRRTASFPKHEIKFEWTCDETHKTDQATLTSNSTADTTIVVKQETVEIDTNHSCNHDDTAPASELEHQTSVSQGAKKATAKTDEGKSERKRSNDTGCESPSQKSAQSKTEPKREKSKSRTIQSYFTKQCVAK